MSGVDALAVIGPLALLIALGAGLRPMLRSGWALVEALTYYVCLPCLLVLELSAASLGDEIWFVVGVPLAASAAVGTSVLCLRWLFAYPTLTSVFQGTVRYNSYVFLGTTVGLMGPGALGLAGTVVAVMIVATNLASIIVLSPIRAGGASVSSVARSVASNPLVVAAVLGIAMSVAAFRIPDGPLAAAAESLAGAALPLSMLTVGAGLQLSSGRRSWAAIAVSVPAKLIVLPAVALAALYALSVPYELGMVVMLYAAAPCAGNCYILARRMGGDAEVMADVTTVSVVASAATLPLACAAYAAVVA